MSASPVQPAVSFPTKSGVLPDMRTHPEFDLLHACCSDAVNREVSIRAALRQPIDWQRLAEAAEHHGVIPAVYENLCHGSDVVPVKPLAAIRQLYESNARRTLWLTRELARVLENLNSLRIPVLPYKGPVLAQTLYGNVTRRQFSDLDLLIHARDFSRAKAALMKLGFQPGIELSLPEERAYLRSGYELTFDSPNGRNLLELQWQILPRFYAVNFDVAGFFDRSVPSQVGGLEVRSLCAEDLLQVLCVHAAKHAWIQLSWLCDIAELAKSSNIDWEVIRKQSAKMGIARIVALSLTLAHELLGAPLAPIVNSDPFAEAFNREVCSLLRQSDDIDPESIAYFRLLARSRERAQDRMRFWWRLAVTPMAGEWSAVRLPAPLFPLYRMVRAVRLARRLF